MAKFSPMSSSHFFSHAGNALRWSVVILSGALALVSCEPPAVPKTPVTQLEQRADGLTYIQGTDQLYSGTYLQLGKNSTKLEEWTYEEGLLHGANTRFNESGQSPRRRIDYEKGTRVRKRSWYPNGQLRGDEGWSGELISGMCTYWFEDGRIRKQLSFGDGFRTQGQIVEYDEDGTLLIDAIMDEGRYLGGFLSQRLDLSDRTRLSKRYFSDKNGKEDSTPPVPSPEKTAKL